MWTLLRFVNSILRVLGVFDSGLIAEKAVRQMFVLDRSSVRSADHHPRVAKAL